MQPQTIDMAPLCLRADVATVDDEKRTVGVILSTGAGVERYDWMAGKRFIEKLSMKPEHIRLGRLNGGAPLLDSHSAWSVGDILGVIEPDTARIEGGKLVATVRFSARESVEEIWQDVRSRIIRHLSIGYRTYKFEEEEGRNNKLPVRTAVDWEPYEGSLVSMPADAGAKVRSSDKSLTNECLIVQRSAATADADRLRRLRLARASAF
jgi:hypothetical protein